MFFLTFFKFRLTRVTYFFEDVPQKCRYKPIINSASVFSALQTVTAATLIEISFPNVSQYLYEIL